MVRPHAVNKGFERAQGELLGWLNGDDEYVSEAVDKAVDHLLGKPDLDAVFGAMDITDERGEVRREYRPARFSWRRYLDLGDYLPTPTIIFRRRLLEHGATRRELRRRSGLRLFPRVSQRYPGASASREPMVRFPDHPGARPRATPSAVRTRRSDPAKWATRPAPTRRNEGDRPDKRRVLPRISAWPRMFP